MIIPIGNRVLVRPHSLEETRPEYQAAKRMGLVIPVSETQKREEFAVDKGIVLATGPNCWEDWNGDDWCQIGDEVVFAKHGGMVIRENESDEKHLVLLNDTDIIAIIRKGT